MSTPHMQQHNISPLMILHSIFCEKTQCYILLFLIILFSVISCNERYWRLVPAMHLLQSISLKSFTLYTSLNLIEKATTLFLPCHLLYPGTRQHHVSDSHPTEPGSETDQQRDHQSHQPLRPLFYCPIDSRSLSLIGHQFRFQACVFECLCFCLNFHDPPLPPNTKTSL